MNTKGQVDSNGVANPKGYNGAPNCAKRGDLLKVWHRDGSIEETMFEDIEDWNDIDKFVVMCEDC